MKGLVVRQPYAGLIAAEIKTLEVRSQLWSYRGPLVIIAAKAWASGWCAPIARQAARMTQHRDTSPHVLNLLTTLGRPLALVDLVSCRRGTREDSAEAIVDPEDVDQQWVYRLRRPRVLFNPPEIQGRLGLITLSDETIKQIFAATPQGKL